MKILKNNLESELKIRTQKDYPIKDVEFIDITPLILEKTLLKEITEKFALEIGQKNVDYIVAPEARGFLFGAPVADRLNIGFIPVRKKGKLPTDYVEKTFSYKKEYGEDILELPKLLDNETYENKVFYIIDDIYATGNTIKSIKNEIEDLGGKVAGVAVVMNISNLNEDKDVFSLLDIEET